MCDIQLVAEEPKKLIDWARRVAVGTVQSLGMREDFCVSAK